MFKDFSRKCLYIMCFEVQFGSNASASHKWGCNLDIAVLAVMGSKSGDKICVTIAACSKGGVASTGN